jgi:hypothetical protein
MLQWKIRLIVLTGSLALIGSALGGVGRVALFHFGW